MAQDMFTIYYSRVCVWVPVLAGTSTPKRLARCVSRVCVCVLDRMLDRIVLRYVSRYVCAGRYVGVTCSCFTICLRQFHDIFHDMFEFKPDVINLSTLQARDRPGQGSVACFYRCHMYSCAPVQPPAGRRARCVRRKRQGISCGARRVAGHTAKGGRRQYKPQL